MKIKVGYIQFDVKKKIEENLSIIENSLSNLNVDIIVLPELSFTGYLFKDKNDLIRHSEIVPDGIACQNMLRLSKFYNCTIVFGVAEYSKDKVFNSAVVVKDGQYLGKYQKIHLSDFEKHYFIPGKENKIFDLGYAKIGVQICFDLWFPEISREQILEGADILLVLANFGNKTTFQIAKIRAIENLTPVVLCNRIGFEKNDQIDAYFLGKSAIYNSNGKLMNKPKKDLMDIAVKEIEIPTIKSNVICHDLIKEIISYKKK